MHTPRPEDSDALPHGGVRSQEYDHYAALVQMLQQLAHSSCLQAVFKVHRSSIEASCHSDRSGTPYHGIRNKKRMVSQMQTTPAPERTVAVTLRPAIREPRAGMVEAEGHPQVTGSGRVAFVREGGDAY